MTIRKDGLDRLIDFMVEDIMAMSDEEILAEASPEEIEQAKEAVRKALCGTRVDGEDADNADNAAR